MAVRSTNVYEDRALGVWDSEGDSSDSDDESAILKKETQFENSKDRRAKVYGQYLFWHARRQLSFGTSYMISSGRSDLQSTHSTRYLVVGLCLVPCCCSWTKEDHGCGRTAVQSFHNQQVSFHSSILSLTKCFYVVFEIVSAYGAIGLSIGLPNANYSTTGAFTPTSKIVMILVMIRARHRGLPAAIDRAVMLPKDEKKQLENVSANHEEDYTPDHSPGPGLALGLDNMEKKGDSALVSDHT